MTYFSTSVQNRIKGAKNSFMMELKVELYRKLFYKKLPVLLKLATYYYSWLYLELMCQLLSVSAARENNLIIGNEFIFSSFVHKNVSSKLNFSLCTVKCLIIFTCSH